MSRISRAFCASSIALLLPPAVCRAQNVDSFSTWLQQGQWLADSRYRIEHVGQDPFVEDALASTLRVRGGFETGR